MYRIAVIGDRDSIYGFAAAGAEVFPVIDTSQAVKKIASLVEEHYVVIYIVESLYCEIADQLQEYEEKTLPAIIPIPGVTGNNGLGIAQVKKFVERAVGADILFADK